MKDVATILKETETRLFRLTGIHHKVTCAPVFTTSAEIDLEEYAYSVLRHRVCEANEVSVSEYDANVYRNIRLYVDCRRMLCTLLEARGWTRPMIKEKMGDKDRTTVLHAINSHSELMVSNPEYRRKFNSINAEIQTHEPVQ